MNIFGKILISGKLLACYIYDGTRFLKHAHVFNDAFRTRDAARANLLRKSHSLEKGLALPNPRAGFGMQLTEDTIADLDRYHDQYGSDFYSISAEGIIRKVIEYHATRGINWDKFIKRLETHSGRIIADAVTPEPQCGTVERSKHEISTYLPPDPEKFFSTRHSVRQFASTPITQDTLEHALRLAQRSPSVCNRQSVRVHIFQDKELMNRILSHQDGNRGFGDNASVVFAVTANLSNFYKNGERNQAFVDGGIFAMGLSMALHSLGCGSCMLNWAMSPRHDLAMRKEMNIPDNEVIITLMVAGNLLDRFVVAASPRRPLRDIACFHELNSGGNKS